MKYSRKDKLMCEYLKNYCISNFKIQGILEKELNSKPETLNPKQIQITKIENPKQFYIHISLTQR